MRGIKCELGHGRSVLMPVPSVEMMLIAGRAVFLVFSFVVAAVTLMRWRNAARAQTEEILAHNAVVLQRLADLEARIDAARLAMSELIEHVGRPSRVGDAPGLWRPGLPDCHPPRPGRRFARGVDFRLRPLAARGRARTAAARPGLGRPDPPETRFTPFRCHLRQVPAPVQARPVPIAQQQPPEAIGPQFMKKRRQGNSRQAVRAAHTLSLRRPQPASVQRKVPKARWC